MEKMLKRLGGLLPSGLLVLGAVAVITGIWILSTPAGIITAGLLSIAGGVLLIQGGDGA